MSTKGLEELVNKPWTRKDFADAYVETLEELRRGNTNPYRDLSAIGVLVAGSAFSTSPSEIAFWLFLLWGAVILVGAHLSKKELRATIDQRLEVVRAAASKKES
jgi:hypothetical protein